MPNRSRTATMKSLHAKTTRRRIPRCRAGGTDETGDYLGKVAQPLHVEVDVLAEEVDAGKSPRSLGEGGIAHTMASVRVPPQGPAVLTLEAVLPQHLTLVSHFIVVRVQLLCPAYDKGSANIAPKMKRELVFAVVALKDIAAEVVDASWLPCLRDLDVIVATGALRVNFGCFHGQLPLLPSSFLDHDGLPHRVAAVTHRGVQHTARASVWQTPPKEYRPSKVSPRLGSVATGSGRHRRLGNNGGRVSHGAELSDGKRLLAGLARPAIR